MGSKSGAFLRFSLISILMIGPGLYSSTTHALKHTHTQPILKQLSVEFHTRRIAMQADLLYDSVR